MNQEAPPSQQTINWTQDQTIAVPSDERLLAIRRSDWERLKRNCSRAADPVPRLHIAYSILFGIGATSALSLLTFSSAENLSPWVVPFHILLTIFCLGGGGYLVRLDRKLHSRQRSQIDDIRSDMEELEKMFPPAQPSPPETMNSSLTGPTSRKARNP